TPAQNAGEPGSAFGIQVGAAASASQFGPIVSFQTTMRTTPTVTLYNPSAANAQIIDLGTGTDWSTSAPTDESQRGFVTTGSTPVGSAPGNGMAVQWSANARLGEV